MMEVPCTTPYRKAKHQGKIDPLWLEPVLSAYKKSEGDKGAAEETAVSRTGSGTQGTMLASRLYCRLHMNRLILPSFGRTMPAETSELSNELGSCAN